MRRGTLTIRARYVYPVEGPPIEDGCVTIRQGRIAWVGNSDDRKSDLDLGDGSGLELMRQVRCRGNTPGIAVSGYATEDDVQQSLEAGFAVHLAKPITFLMLESAIQYVTAAGSACAPPPVEAVLT